MGHKGEITKNKILETTIALILKKGIEDTSISDIVTETGIAKGSIFFHFPDKQTLISKALEKYEEKFFIFLENSLSGETAGEKLVNFFECVKAVHAKKKYVGGCVFGNTALEMADKNEALAGIVINVFKKWTTKIAEVAKQAAENGEIRKDVAPEDLANHIIASIEGGIMLSRLQKGGEPLDKTLSVLSDLVSLKVKHNKEAICQDY